VARLLACWLCCAIALSAHADTRFVATVGFQQSLRLTGSEVITIELRAHPTAQVLLVEQLGIDVKLSVLGEQTSRSNPTGAWGPESIVSTQARSISIRPKSPGSPAGRIKIRVLSGLSPAQIELWRNWSAAAKANGLATAQGYADALSTMRIVAVGATGEYRVAARYSIASLLRNLNQHSAALEAYNDLLNTPTLASGWRARSLNGRGLSLIATEQYARAAADFAAAERSSQQAQDAYEWTTAKNNQCLAKHYQGELEWAQACYRRTIEAYRERALGEHVAVALLNLAAVSTHLGQPAAAIAALDEALAIRRAGSDRMSLGIVLNNLAMAHFSIGRWQAALQASSEAEGAFSAINDPQQLARVWLIRARIYHQLGESARAQQLLQQAVSSATQSGDQRTAMLAKSDLGLELKAEAARALHQAARAHWTQSSQPMLEASEWLHLADRELEMARLDDAQVSLANAQTIAEARGSAPLLLRAHLVRAKLESAQSQWTDALSEARLALRLSTELRDPHSAASSAALAARALIADAQFQAAIEQLITAIQRLDREIQLPASPLLRANLTDQHAELSELLIEQLFARGQPSDAALEMALAAKFVSSQTQAAFSLTQAPLLDELRAKVALLNDTRSVLPEARRAELKSDIEALESRLDLMAPQQPFAEPQGLTLMQLRAALAPTAALLIISSNEKSSHAIVVEKARWSHIKLPSKAALNAAIATLEKTPAARPAWQPLSGLLAPLADALAGVSRVWLLTDDPLTRVPWAALAHRKGGYWIEHWELIRLSAMPKSPASLGSTQLLDGYQIGLWRSTPSSSALEQITLPRLRAFEAEATLIKRAQPNRVIELNARNAASSTRPMVLHIASHGLASLASPRAAALALPIDQGAGIPHTEQFQLSGPELLDAFKTPPQLVFLNACEGAQGRTTQARIDGLAGGFLSHRAQAVIAPLWPISDSSAARFSADFYAALNASANADPVSAIAAAQREALARPRGARQLDQWAGYVIYR